MRDPAREGNTWTEWCEEGRVVLLECRGRGTLGRRVNVPSVLFIEIGPAYIEAGGINKSVQVQVCFQVRVQVHWTRF